MNWRDLYCKGEVRVRRKTHIGVLVLISLIAAAGVLVGILSGMPSSCLAGPIAFAKIGSLPDFLDWYESDDAGAGCAVLTGDLVIDGTVELGAAGRSKELNTREFTIRIVNQGRLAVDNPDFYFMGNKEIMTVENGGRLSLVQGGTYESLYPDHILIKGGGKYKISSHFRLAGGIRDENKEPETPEAPDEGSGDVTPAARPILPNPESTAATVACSEGIPPEKDVYPASDLVLYQAESGKYEWTEIPVEWDLAPVDFNRAGVYKVRGIYCAEALKAANLCNPGGLQASLNVAVLSRMTAEIESADILSTDKYGYAVMRIRIPQIPKNAVGLYLYYSFDQISYTMAAWSGTDGEYNNYLEHNAVSGQAYDYIVFKYSIGNRPIWLKTQLKVRDGDTVRTMTSQPVRCRNNAVPEETKQSSDSDGSSGGNRGGGGQGTSGRGGVVPGSGSGEPGAGTGGTGAGMEGLAGGQAGYGMGANSLDAQPAVGQPGMAGPDTDRTAPGNGSASAVPAGNGIDGEGTKKGLERDAYGRPLLLGDGSLESGDGSERTGDTASGRAGKDEAGPAGDGDGVENGVCGDMGKGADAAAGQRGRARRFVYAFAGSGAVLLTVHLGMRWFKGGKAGRGMRGFLGRWGRKIF